MIFEIWLYVWFGDDVLVVINVGLLSEIVFGLSEEGYVGGRFLWFDFVEWLDWVLVEIWFDLVIVCYGINCGIY